MNPIIIFLTIFWIVGYAITFILLLIGIYIAYREIKQLIKEHDDDSYPDY